MLTYRAVVPGLSTAHLRYVADMIREHRAEIGSRWRRLPPARQVLLVLLHLRCGDPYAHLALSSGVGTTTARRYIDETVELLAAAALQLATTIAARTGCEVTILDCTIGQPPGAVDCRTQAVVTPARRPMASACRR